MEDGLCHKAAVYEDVASYVPTGPELQAAGITGGFPCQATQFLDAACDFDGCLIVDFMSFLWRLCGQGISRSGKQKGLADDRSNLVRHIFRLLRVSTSLRSDRMFTEASS